MIQNYRETIIEALNRLNIAQTSMFTAMVNIGMAGTFKQLDFEAGDVVPFEIESFENSGDANLDVIIDLIKKMELAKMSIMNLNGVNEDELDEVPAEA